MNMSDELAIDPRPDGSMSIIYHCRQYRREPGSGGPWLNRTFANRAEDES